jgi:hypothetical protein
MYDPMDKPPRAAPSGRGSGLNPPAGNPPRPPLTQTNEDRKTDLDGIVDQTHRPLPGSGERQ